MVEMDPYSNSTSFITLKAAQYFITIAVVTVGLQYGDLNLHRVAKNHTDLLKIDTASYLQNSFIVSTICIDKIRPLSKLPAEPYREK